MSNLLTNSDHILLEVAHQYPTVEDFKKYNLPKYLLAKKKLLLKIAFPTTPTPAKSIEGIYYLYKDAKIVYIGHAMNCLNSIQHHVIDSSMQFNNYKIYKTASDSDRYVLALYLANKYRPRHNTNLGLTKLSFEIPNIPSILAKPIKGVI